MIEILARQLLLPILMPMSEMRRHVVGQEPTRELAVRRRALEGWGVAIIAAGQWFLAGVLLHSGHSRPVALQIARLDEQPLLRSPRAIVDNFSSGHLDTQVARPEKARCSW
jgi:hypothetical protein